MHHVAFGAAPQVGPQGDDLRDRFVQALKYRLQFGPGLLVALLAAGFERFAPFRRQAGLQLTYLFSEGGDLASALAGVCRADSCRSASDRAGAGRGVDHRPRRSGGIAPAQHLREHAPQTTYCSPTVPFIVMTPSVSSCLTSAMICCCAASTSLIRTGPIDSSSSFIISVVRADMVAKK